MDNKKIIEAVSDGVNMVEHHEQKFPWIGRGEVEVRVALRNEDGKLIGGEDVFTKRDLFNSITDQGANSLFAVYFAGAGTGYGAISGAKSSAWYMGLTTSAPGPSSTLGSIQPGIEIAAATQPVIGGVYRKPITWVWDTTRHVKSGNLVWTANAAWSPGATHLFLCDVSGTGTNGILFNYLALSATRTPAAQNDTITVSWDGSL
jgi:hypothetical protein